MTAYNRPTYGQPQQDRAAPRRKRRIFLWVFLAIQALFVIWLIAGLSSSPAGPSVAAQTAHACAGTGWQGLFKSHADCMRHYAAGVNAASDIGSGIGAAIIIAFWAVVDVILGIGYGVYKLSRR